MNVLSSAFDVDLLFGIAVGILSLVARLFLVLEHVARRLDTLQLATKLFLEVAILNFLIMDSFDESGLQTFSGWVIAVDAAVPQVSVFVVEVLVLQTGVVIGVGCVCRDQVGSVNLARVLHLCKVVKLWWLVGLELL